MKLGFTLALLVLTTPLFAEEKPTEELPEYKVTALASVNQRRTRIGRRPVKYSKELNEAADKHAEWMAAHWMSHTGVNGSRPYQRVRWAKYPGSFTGEIIAVADRQSRAVSMWTGSPPHYSIMVSSGATEVGISCGESKNGTRYWVAVFGRPTK